MSSRSAARGFTLIELIVVMVVAGIILAVGAPRFFDAAAFREAALRDEVLAAVRYGQKVATASRCWVRVTVNGSVGGDNFAYALDFLDQPGLAPADGDCFSGSTGGDWVRRPPGGPGAGQRYAQEPGSVAVSGSFSFMYDRAGRPRSTANTPLAADPTASIGGRAIAIDRESGLAR